MSKYIKNNYDVREDTMNWSLLKSSAIFKDKVKKEYAEKEIIDSYVASMNLIGDQISKDYIKGMCILKSYSLCIPFMYICRHIVELSLKLILEHKLNVSKKGHNIKKLW